MLPRKVFKGMKLFDGCIYNPGSRIEIDKEPLLSEVSFKIHKFNNRPKPTITNRIAIFSCFAEFGSEIVGCLYCLPKLLQNRYLGYYSIAVGWTGRAFLYQHIVDEFWELNENYQWLRDYCRAFHHESRNLRLIEKCVRKHGLLVHANEMSLVALKDVFPHVDQVRKYAAFPIIKNVDKIDEISEFVKYPNLVGITARNRRCYGRNLDISFYKKLICKLKNMGYVPIWMGEKSTTHDCPFDDMLNFRDSKHSNDLEKTLLLTSKLDFTIQCYTASSRLAGLVGTPYIIVESPDQLGGLRDGMWGQGQEGLRLRLCTKGNKMKVIHAHYKDIDSNHDHGLNLINQAILEIKENNYNDIVCNSGEICLMN